MTPTQSKLSDQGMVRIMGMVLAALLGLLVFIFLVARVLGDAADDSETRDALLQSALEQRLSPVGQVRTADEAAAQEEVAVAEAGPVKTGEELVTVGACAGCHAAGVAGAPKIGDDAAWAERREQGYDTLVSAVINGLNAMPARGGSTYTDDEIKRAVKFIAMFPDSEVPADVGTEDAAAAPAEGAAATADASGGDEAPADAQAGGQAGGQAAEQAGGQAEDAEAANAGDAAAPAAEGGSAGEASQPADAPADAAPAAGSEEVALVVGQAPADLSDNVKTAVDGVCAGCHMAGVAGAPKLGDVAAWQERADKGIATLTASVANGKGAMPARGGSSLTDEEIPAAIQYLMSK